VSHFAYTPYTQNTEGNIAIDGEDITEEQQAQLAEWLRLVGKGTQ
jgi:ABC-type multidrug transport system fused ATPase/permease subunit